MTWLTVNQRFSKKNSVRLSFKSKAFKITNDPKDDGRQRALASMVYKFFDKKSSGSGVATESNYQLANELRRQIIRKFKTRKVYSSFRTIFGVYI